LVGIDAAMRSQKSETQKSETHRLRGWGVLDAIGGLPSPYSPCCFQEA
jgi:hypothetical protein